MNRNKWETKKIVILDLLIFMAVLHNYKASCHEKNIYNMSLIGVIYVLLCCNIRQKEGDIYSNLLEMRELKRADRVNFLINNSRVVGLLLLDLE